MTRPWDRRSSVARFYVGVVAITASTILVSRTVKEGLHTFEIKAADKIRPTEVLPDPRRVAEAISPIYAGPTSV